MAKDVDTGKSGKLGLVTVYHRLNTSFNFSWTIPYKNQVPGRESLSGPVMSDPQSVANRKWVSCLSVLTNQWQWMRGDFAKVKIGCPTRRRHGFGQVKHSTYVPDCLQFHFWPYIGEMLALYKREEGMSWNLENSTNMYRHLWVCKCQCTPWRSGRDRM